MANVFRLKCESGTPTPYNLLTSVIYAAVDGWKPAPIEPGGSFPVQVIRCYGVGTEATVTAAENEIDYFGLLASIWHGDMFRTNAVWFETYMDGGTPVQSLVSKIILKQVRKKGFDPLMTQGYIAYDLVIEHYPNWERTATVTWLDATTFQSIGAAPSYSACPTGTMPARIWQTKIDAPGAQPTNEFWIGFKPTRFSRTNFDPVLELEDGAMGTNAATGDIADGSPAAGPPDNAVVVTLGNENLVERVVYRISDQSVAGTYEQYIGSYRVLLRCKVSASSVFGVQLRHGFKNDPSKIPMQELYDVDNSAGWEVYDLGEVSIPGHPVRSDMVGLSLDHMGDYELSIYAELITDSGNGNVIDLDCLILVPSEHFFYAYASNMNLGGTFMYGLVHEDNEQSAVYVTGGLGAATPEFVMNRWHYPTDDDGVIVVVCQRSEATRSVLADTLDITMKYMARFINHGT